MKKILLTIGSVLVIGGSVWSLWGRYYRSTPNLRPPDLIAVGTVAAEEVRKVIPPNGRVVLVVCRAPLEMLGMEAVVEGFQRALPPVATERINIKNLAGRVAAAQQLQALMEKYATADAVVTIGGAGFLDEQVLLKASQPRPLLMPVLSFTPPQLLQMLTTPRVSFAIMPNSRAVPPERPPQTPREWFDSVFLIVTPETPAAVFE